MSWGSMFFVSVPNGTTPPTSVAWILKARPWGFAEPGAGAWLPWHGEAAAQPRDRGGRPCAVTRSPRRTGRGGSRGGGGTSGGEGRGGERSRVRAIKTADRPWRCNRGSRTPSPPRGKAKLCAGLRCESAGGGRLGTGLRGPERLPRASSSPALPAGPRALGATPALSRTPGLGCPPDALPFPAPEAPGRSL